MPWNRSVSLACALIVLLCTTAPASAQIVEGNAAAVENQTTTGVSQEVQTALPGESQGTTAPSEEEDGNGMDPENSPARRLEAVKNEVKACADMKERSARLLCYDDLATAIGAMPEAFKAMERQKVAAYGFWQVLSETDQLGIETIYLSQSPYNRLSSVAQQVNVPNLSIRCRQGNTDVYLDWRSTLTAGRQNVREIFLFIQNDSEPETRYSWQLSLDGYAAFANDPIEFVKSLRGKRKMQMRITPTGGNTETLMFEISRIDEALNILVKRCYAQGSAQQPPTSSRLGK